MKHVKRFLAMCMAVVMLCGVTVSADHAFSTEKYPGEPGTRGFYGTAETGIYGTRTQRLPYPITYNFFYEKEFDKGDNWWIFYNYTLGNISSSGMLSRLAYRWFESYRVTSPEIWCAEFLDKYEGYLSTPITATSPLDSEKAQYRVSDYSWDGRTLKAQCEADYNLSYDIYESIDLNTEEPAIFVEVEGEFRMGACIALTDKDTGELVYLVQHDSFVLEPDYAYRRGVYDIDTFEVDQDLIAEKTTGTATDTFEMTLPERYDPEKYDASLYFFNNSPNYLTNVPGIKEFFGPNDVTYGVTASEIILGDVDGDGEVSVTDLSYFARMISSGGELGTEADMNGDGEVTVSDLATMRRILSGGEL